MSERRVWLVWLLMVSMAVTAGVAGAKGVVGWVEEAQLNKAGISVYAKVDTGAENSSLHATHLEPFSRGGEDWIRFRVIDRMGKVVTLERPVYRIARIKRHSGKDHERVVVMLDVCVGSVRKTVEVNLVDRSRFEYPMLIGRSFMSGEFMVDPGAQYLAPPACAANPGNE